MDGPGFRGRGSRRRDKPCSFGINDRGGSFSASGATHAPVMFLRRASCTVRPWRPCSPTASSSCCASGVRLKSLENIWNDALSSRGGARIDGRLNSLLLVALCLIVEEKVSCFRTFAFKHQHDFARRSRPNFFSQPSQSTSPVWESVASMASWRRTPRRTDGACGV